MATDSEFFLAILQERPGEWVAARPEIQQRALVERGVGLNPSECVRELRRQGFTITELEVSKRDWYRRRSFGQPESYYKLVETGPADAMPGRADARGASNTCEIAGCDEPIFAYGLNTDGTFDSLCREHVGENK